MSRIEFHFIFQHNVMGDAEYCCGEQSKYISDTWATTSRSHHKSGDGWIGHLLNPIGCLFETLVDASQNDNELSQHKKYHPKCRKHLLGTRMNYISITYYILSGNITLQLVLF